MNNTRQHESQGRELPDEGSITRVIREMQAGKDEGAEFLWRRFYDRLKRIVRDRMSPQLGPLSDEEDVALQSLAELFTGLLDGNYPALANRHSFWRLLLTVAHRNAIDEINRENRQKRGSGKVVNESAYQTSDDDATALFDQTASGELSPDMKVMVSEQCAKLLEMLDDPQLQAIAIMKTADTTNQDIADALGISLRSVERRLAEIRSLWNVDDAH